MVDCDIVVIDSGFNFNNDINVSGITIKKDGKNMEICNAFSDDIGHGTIICSIIGKQAPTNKIFVIKLSDELDTINEACLLFALEYIKNNINCRLINLSLGITEGERIHDLYRLCSELSSKGIVIVSAYSNDGSNSYPASFDCVIGVDNHKKIRSINEYAYVENSSINILAKGDLQRLVMSNGEVLLTSGSSIACAHITAILANAPIDNLNLENAMSYLKSRAKRLYPSSKNKCYNNNGNTIFDIKNAVVFPFGKEAHAFLRFPDMLMCDIKDYYDVSSSGKVGRQLKRYYEDTKSDKSVLNIDKLDFTDIDTVILGHLDELNELMRRDYKAELIEKAIAAHVNIFSFDPLDTYNEMLERSNIKHFYPSVTSFDVRQNTFGKLYCISKPVVGIFGTSSQQGKFSLQLTLKRELELAGYDVGNIGTEPHSPLFKCDVVFPMGYNSTVRLSNSEIVLYLNDALNKICLKGKEIILVASQAQFVPYCGNNLMDIPLMQYHFALGTKPDTIVLCVNYHDEIRHINNTVRALLGITDSSLLAFVMYPLTYSNDWTAIYGNRKRKITYEEFNKKKRILQEEFRVPVYLLGDKQHMSDLCQDVINYF